MKRSILFSALIILFTLSACSSDDDNVDVDSDDSIDFTDYDQVHELMQGDWLFFEARNTQMFTFEGDNYTVTDMEKDYVIFSGEFELEPATDVYNVIVSLMYEGEEVVHLIVSDYDDGVATTNHGKLFKQ